MICPVLYSSILFGTLKADAVSFKKADGMSSEEIKGGGM
jgi:hypothetical protein